MKRRLAFFLPLFGAIACASAAGVLAAAGGEVRLREVRGDVVLSRGEKFLVCEKGMRCEKGDQILTRGPAQADIVWGGLWGCRMLDLSILTVTETDPAAMSVRLEKGAMLFRFRKMPAACAFSLETPTAIAAVRGTQFATWVTDEGGRERATFALLFGELRIEARSAPGTPLTLRAGEAVDVYAEGTALVARPLSDSERDILSRTETLSTGTRDPARRYI